LRNILVSGISSAAGIMVMGLVEYIWYYPRVMLMFWIILGILLTAAGLARNSEQKINLS